MEHNIETRSCGQLKVFSSGLSASSNQFVILTCHDLGVNHNEFEDFLKNDDMVFLSTRIAWVHLEIPGQGDNEQDLPDDFEFPNLDKVAEAISDVCAQLKITSCVLFGEGAGANILARFAMIRDDLVLGAVLIHCTGASAGFLESVKDKLTSHQLDTQGISPKAESYLLYHRFGTVKENPDEYELRHALANFKNNLRKSINPKNLNQYIQTYMNRSNLLDKVQSIKCPVLLITGALASHYQTVTNLHTALRSSLKDKVELIVIDEIANPIRERPEKVSETLLYFLQGLGLAGGLMTRRMSNVLGQQALLARRASMEESDKPIGVENLTYCQDRKYSTAGDNMQSDIQKFLSTQGDKN